MSDDILYLFPVDPLLQLPADAAGVMLAKARALFKQTPAHRITAVHNHTPRFICCMTNLRTVRCPACHADLRAWWNDAMSAWHDGDRANLCVTTPCCQAQTDLNALAYDWPQGFACFYVAIENPREALTEDGQIQLEQALGAPMRKVWSHV